MLSAKYGGVVKGQRKIMIVADDPNAKPREYSIPRGEHSFRFGVNSNYPVRRRR